MSPLCTSLPAHPKEHVDVPLRTVGELPSLGHLLSVLTTYERDREGYSHAGGPLPMGNTLGFSTFLIFLTKSEKQRELHLSAIPDSCVQDHREYPLFAHHYSLFLTINPGLFSPQTG